MVRNSSGRGYKQQLALALLRDNGFEAVQEHQFFAKRKWRFDLAIPDLKIAIEIEGGVKAGAPSHSSITGIMRDIEKYNVAQLLGWVVFRTYPDQVLGDINKVVLPWIANDDGWQKNFSKTAGQLTRGRKPLRKLRRVSQSRGYRRKAAGVSW